MGSTGAMDDLDTFYPAREHIQGSGDNGIGGQNGTATLAGDGLLTAGRTRSEETSAAVEPTTPKSVLRAMGGGKFICTHLD